MQEDVEQRSVTLAVNGTKFTGRLLKSIISKYLAHRKEKQHEKVRSGEVIHHGKQTVTQRLCRCAFLRGTGFAARTR